MATRKLASTRQILSGDYDREIYEAMARAMFVDDWANRQEEKGKHFPGGTELMDVAPPTSRDALLAARALAAAVIKDNGVKSLTDLYARALNAGGEGDAREFGHYLAMEAMGHGVSWYDDGNPEFGLKLPHFEYYSGRGRVAQKLGYSTGKARKGLVAGDAKSHVGRGEAWRRAVRQAAGAAPNALIQVVPGRAAPIEEGETSHYTNKGGTRIEHPNAYRKKGFNMVYHASTRKVVVGADWKPAGFASGSKAKTKRTRVKASCACSATAVVRKKSKKASTRKK